MENGVRILTSSDILDHGTTKQDTLGARGVTADGRRWVYALSDSSAGLAAGKLGIAAAVTANHVNRSLDSTSLGAAGGKVVVVSVGATAVTQDQYADGYLVVRDGTGKGQTLRINGNVSVGSSGGAVTVYLFDPIATALSTSDTKVDLISPFNGVVASTTLSRPIGVPMVTLAAGEYGWLQTHGTAAVLSDGAITKGVQGIQSTSVAGAVAIAAVGAIATMTYVGSAPELTVDTKYTQFNLNIPGL
jgi:hypothetical protein